MDRKSNEVWTTNTNHAPFETRAFRFRPDMRPLFFQYLGITPDSRVLDGGCGTGVFTRYLAEGLKDGHITGFDINEGFVAYGQERAAALGLAGRMRLEVADGFALPYADGAFDAVTNYTYLGVLSDPEAGLRELTRVCRPGGTVSCAVASTGIPTVEWLGDYPFAGAEALQALRTRERYIFTHHVNMGAKLHQSQAWPPLRYPKLLEVCGLREIHLYPFAYALCFSDTQYDAALRKQIALDNTREDMDWCRYRFEENRAVYHSHGFSDADAARMLTLLADKLAYLEAHFEEDRSYEWLGGFNFVVSGTK